MNQREIPLKIKVGELRIDKALVTQLSSPLIEPFKISLGTQYNYDGTVIELQSGDLTGYGEGSTVAEITGESPGGIFETASYILEHIKEHEFESLEDILQKTDRSIYSNPTAKNAIDIALHDLVGKSVDLHVARILGGTMKSIPTSLTITIGSVEENLKALQKLKKLKTKIIKVKVGIDADSDIERIKAISANLDDQAFFADANQGYSLRDAIRVGNALRDAGALFFEQPMEKHSLANLRQLRTQAGLPVMLDESISDPRDVINAIISESADLVNVKLTKSGGIRKAFKTLATAQAYGIDAMVGCMIESKLGISASLAVASSLSNVKYTDLDGFHSLTAQPFEGGVIYDSGINRAVAGIGLAAKPLKNDW